MERNYEWGKVFPCNDYFDNLRSEFNLVYVNFSGFLSRDVLFSRSNINAVGDIASTSLVAVREVFHQGQKGSGSER